MLLSSGSCLFAYRFWKSDEQWKGGGVLQNPPKMKSKVKNFSFWFIILTFCTNIVHLDINMEAPNFCCDICHFKPNKRIVFTSKRSMLKEYSSVMHVITLAPWMVHLKYTRIKHKGEKLQCKLCSYAHDYSSELNKHMKKEHGPKMVAQKGAFDSWKKDASISSPYKTFEEMQHVWIHFSFTRKPRRTREKTHWFRWLHFVQEAYKGWPWNNKETQKNSFPNWTQMQDLSESIHVNI